MRLFLLACLLPLLVAGSASLLVDALPAPETADPPPRQVRTFVAVDSSGNGHHGIVQGRAELGLHGHAGTSYSFSRRGSWVQVPPSVGIDPAGRDFLVSAWVSLEETPGRAETYDVVRKGVADTTPGEFKLEVLQHGAVRCTAKDATHDAATVISTERIVPDARWHRIGCARTGTSWSVIVDDTVNSRHVQLGSVSNTVPLAIGSKYGLEDRPEGRVDDVRLIVDRRPDGGGAPSLRRALGALEQQAPAGWWRLDDAATGPAGR